MSTKSKKRVKRRVYRAARTAERAWVGIGPGKRRKRKHIRNMAETFNALNEQSHKAHLRGDHTKGNELSVKAGKVWEDIRKKTKR
jgi:hypothetical protein